MGTKFYVRSLLNVVDTVRDSDIFYAEAFTSVSKNSIIVVPIILSNCQVVGQPVPTLTAYHITSVLVLMLIYFDAYRVCTENF